MARKMFRYPNLFLLIIVLLISVAGVSAGQADPYIIFEQAPSTAGKIDPAVREELAGEDHVEVLVKMTRQVDTGRVALDAGRNAPSGSRGRTIVRAAVVEKLQANAASGQKDIIHYLEQEQINGNVLEFHGYYIVNMLFVKAAPVVVEQIARRSDVKVILPNTVIPLKPPKIVERSDTTPLAVEWGVSRINAPDVWALGFDGEGVVVGIIDTGADWQHEAIRTRWRGYNPAAPGNPDVDYNWYDATLPKSALPKDTHGHGTHVTGTVLGAAGSNEIGVAPGARWIAARVFDDDGYATDQGILYAGEFMLAPTDTNGNHPRPDLAPNIVNNSWGDGVPGSGDEWYREMVGVWRDAGILPVFAAGNDGRLGDGTITNPANYPECLAVAATDSGNGLADFSSRGPGYLEGIKPEISAPGVNIRSSLPGGGYGLMDGTSMAAPHVSGAAALILSANPDLNVDHLEQAIIDTAVPLTSFTYPLSPNYGFGYGLVDVLSAVNSSGCGLLTGQILVRGFDNKAPVIEHVQEINTVFAESSFPLGATVSDNVAVNEVKAMVRTAGAAKWTELPMYRHDGDHLSGDYWVQVPWSLVDEPGLEYKIAAVDFAGLQAETGIFSVAVQFGLTPGWSEDFASQPALWEWDGDWERGVPATGPAPQHGGKVMATNLDGNYSNDQCSFLWAPPLDLRQAGSPYLRLDHRYETEEYYDAAMVFISDDCGESWDGYLWDGDSDGWQTHYINLNPYKGGTEQVHLVFVFEADESFTYPGWYIDRVSVVEMETAEQNIFFADFEQNNGGFSVEVFGNDSWGWGSPTSGPGQAYSGNKLWATNLKGDYPSGSDSILWSPVINLGAGGSVYLEFQHWFSIESIWDHYNDMPYDGGLVALLTPEDDSLWTVQDPWYYGSKAYWSSDLYNLSFFLEQGYSQLQVGFWFYSDDSYCYPGWYLDDVRVFTVEPGIQVHSAGPVDNWVPVEAGFRGLMRSGITGDRDRLKLPRGSRSSKKDRVLDLEIPFRQPLQGPDPVVQPCDEPKIQLLPAAATITVLETGAAAATDPADGTYRLWHPPTGLDETLTLQVTAPGFKTEEVQFTLEMMETKVFDFILEPSSTGAAGDLNGDGTVNVADAIILLRSIVGLVTLDPPQLLAADVNLDGVVNVADAVVILRYVVGLVPGLPV